MFAVCRPLGAALASRLPLLKRLTLACVSVAAALGLLEGAMRLLDWPQADPVWAENRETAFGWSPQLDYRHMQPEYDVQFCTNRLGLRDREVEAKHGRRILLLGDSVTCGYGVEQHETFADLLEARLGVDVINAGVGGYEIIHQLRYFQTAGHKLQADEVIYALYLGNDLTNNRSWHVADDGRLERVDGRPALEADESCKLLTLLRRSPALRRMAHAGRGWFKSSREWSPLKAYLAMCQESPSAKAREDLAAATALVEQLAEEVTRTGATFQVVLVPCRTAIEDTAAAQSQARRPAGTPPHDFDKPSRDMAELLSQRDIEHVTLEDALRQDHRRLRAPLYYPLDGHLTVLGHQRVAEHLAERLRR